MQPVPEQGEDKHAIEPTVDRRDLRGRARARRRRRGGRRHPDGRRQGRRRGQPTASPSGWKDRHGRPVHREHRSARDRPENAQAGLKKRLWARLDKMGNIDRRERSLRSTSRQSRATRQGQRRQYVVDFKTNVSPCSWSASPFVPVGNAPPHDPSALRRRHRRAWRTSRTYRSGCTSSTSRPGPADSNVHRAGALLIRSAAATAPAGPSPRPGSGLLGARAVEQLQQVVRRQLHVLVAPLGRAIDAGDQPGAVDAAEIAVHEGVAGLRLLRRPLGEAEVPFGVLVPGVGLQEGVLLAGAGLDGAPVASEDVLVGRDQAPGAADAAIAPGSFRVAPSPRRPSGSPCRLARCGSGDAVRLSRRPVDPMSTRQRATELLRAGDRRGVD